jgi:hypothetical protein
MYRYILHSSCLSVISRLTNNSRKYFLRHKLVSTALGNMYARNRIFTSIHSLSITFQQVCRTASVTLAQHAHYHLSTSTSVLFPCIDYILLNTGMFQSLCTILRECIVQRETLRFLYVYDRSISRF